MEIVSNKEEMIFKSVYNEKEFYSIGVSKKKQDNTYEKGYIPVRFKKDVVLENKTKIKIKSAWLDFYKKEKSTIPYIFINEFEIVNEEKKENVDPFEEMNVKVKSDVSEQIQITDEDLPF